MIGIRVCQIHCTIVETSTTLKENNEKIIPTRSNALYDHWRCSFGNSILVPRDPIKNTIIANDSHHVAGSNVVFYPLF